MTWPAPVPSPGTRPPRGNRQRVERGRGDGGQECTRGSDDVLGRLEPEASAPADPQQEPVGLAMAVAVAGIDLGHAIVGLAGTSARPPRRTERTMSNVTGPT
jgi:hypothetical protein